MKNYSTQKSENWFLIPEAFPDKRLLYFYYMVPMEEDHVENLYYAICKRVGLNIIYSHTKDLDERIEIAHTAAKKLLKKVKES